MHLKKEIAIFVYICMLFKSRGYLDSFEHFEERRKFKEAEKVGNLCNSWTIAGEYKQGEIALMHWTFETSSCRSRCQS